MPRHARPLKNSKYDPVKFELKMESFEDDKDCQQQTRVLHEAIKIQLESNLAWFVRHVHDLFEVYITKNRASFWGPAEVQTAQL